MRTQSRPMVETCMTQCERPTPRLLRTIGHSLQCKYRKRSAHRFVYMQKQPKSVKWDGCERMRGVELIVQDRRLERIERRTV